MNVCYVRIILIDDKMLFCRSQSESPLPRYSENSSCDEIDYGVLPPSVIGMAGTAMSVSVEWFTK